MIVQPITIRAAKALCRLWHRHLKPPRGGLFAIGAAHEGQLVGVAIVGRPIARHNQDGSTCEVLRTATVEAVAPRGACSFLLARCRRIAGMLGYRRVLTMTLESEGGASLRGAGWRCLGISEGHDGWSSKGRPREPGPLDGQTKIRWEADCA